MSAWDALLLGIVEGITEFLPISSTGHLILTSTLLGLPATEFLKTFEIAIQLGAIGAVVLLYWRSFLDTHTLFKIGLAFIPTAIVGFLLYSVIKTYLLGNVAVVLSALLLGGIALIVFELLHKERPQEGDEPHIAEVTPRQALLVGLFQALAIVPGVSRSAATIVGGLLLGVRRTTIVQFSFLLAVPTMVAATTLDLVRTGPLLDASQFVILGIGFVTSLVVAMVSMKFLLAFVRTHTFIPFGIYRIALAGLFFFLVIL